MPLNLRIEDLVLDRGELRLINGLSIHLKAGEALVVTGPNGSGKSTLLRAIGGLFPAGTGQIRLTTSQPMGGAEFDGDVGSHAHYLGHLDALRGAFTTSENLTFWAAMLRNREEGLSLGEALDRVGLAHVADLPCAYLSAGQKRRAALARLLIAPRPIWLLDEPMTALDAKSQSMVTELMLSHLAQGGIIAAATHSPLGIPGLRELQIGLTA